MLFLIKTPKNVSQTSFRYLILKTQNYYFKKTIFIPEIYFFFSNAIFSTHARLINNSELVWTTFAGAIHPKHVILFYCKYY